MPSTGHSGLFDELLVQDAGSGPVCPSGSSGSTGSGRGRANGCIGLLGCVARELEQSPVQDEEAANQTRPSPSSWAASTAGPRTSLVLPAVACSTRWVKRVASETPSITVRQNTSIWRRKFSRDVTRQRWCLSAKKLGNVAMAAASSDPAV